MRQLKIIWTRSVEEWPLDQQWVLPSDPLLRLPCIDFSPLPVQWPRDGFAAVVVANLRSATLMAPYVTRRNTLVVTFGEKAFAALVPLSPRLHLLNPKARTLAETVDEICDLIPASHSIGLPGPKKRSFDLQAALESRGRRAIRVDLYETIATPVISFLPPAWQNPRDFMAEVAGVVTFFSPSAVQGWRMFMESQGVAAPWPLDAVVIGPTTEKACRGLFQRIVMAPENSAAAVLATARGLVGAP
jgi:uroporphyrinogen-III synthase